MKTIIIGLMLLSSICFANPIATDLEKGEEAPFAGYLFNLEGIEELTIHKDYQMAQAKLTFETVLEEQKLTFETNLSAKDIVINSLREQLEARPVEEAQDNTFTYIAIGTSGVLVGLAAGLILPNIL